jgi:hypothetical protein
MAIVRPILDSDLPAVSRFLARGFHADGDWRTWLSALDRRWAAHRPNCGFMLLDDDRIVGAIGAIYSDQPINGKTERFCSINNWYVDPAYRQYSISLLSRLLAQKDVHFTNLTPRPDLVGVFKALNFDFVDDGRVTYVINLPALPAFSRSKVLTDPDAARAVLPPASAKAFRDHLTCPGLQQVALGNAADGFCHVAFYRTAIRRIPCIAVIHVGNRQIFSRHLPALRSHFLLRCRTPLARIESRLMSAAPRLAIELKREPHHMFFSRTLSSADVSTLYTEIPAMHAGSAM